jgi:glucose dehydrogenase
LAIAWISLGIASAIGRSGTPDTTGAARQRRGRPTDDALRVGSAARRAAVVTPCPNNLLAIDLMKTGGALKAAYEPHPDRRALGIACCDVVNRGAPYADGKIVHRLLDATVVAVDANDGHEAWRTKVGNIDLGETFTAAPASSKAFALRRCEDD